MTQIPSGTEQSFGVIPVRREGDRVLFLVIRHTSGHWAFPKGHASVGETDIEAARRELREETGIRNVTLVPDLVFEERYLKPAWGRPDQHVEKTVRYFLGWVNDPTVRVQPSEIQDYRWAPYDEARDLITFDQSRGVLDQAALALGLITP
ncbi:MAG: NUDIX domain-containing protein [Anaerolineae bacterium]|nr:NUDIX domain-containing protein [Anaerolineae bacterium]